MKLLMMVAGVGMLVVGLILLGRTGERLWASDADRSHSVMIYLFLLFLLFPVISMILGSKKRR